ncbi:MAG: helix-turn-helix transcriptional regulator [Acidimicrobiales bacterium]|nr:helix-turn-helix transcriptional regulator [Acidimicrobiales bacterium]
MKVDTVIRTARQRAGLSLRGLAERSGTSHATLAAYEHGRKVPRADTLARILDAAGVALVPTPIRRSDHDLAARRAKGDELVEALRLAARFPARHAPTMGYPRFGQVA